MYCLILCLQRTNTYKVKIHTFIVWSIKKIFAVGVQPKKFFFFNWKSVHYILKRSGVFHNFKKSQNMLLNVFLVSYGIRKYSGISNIDTIALFVFLPGVLLFYWSDFLFCVWGFRCVIIAFGDSLGSTPELCGKVNLFSTEENKETV